MGLKVIHSKVPSSEKISNYWKFENYIFLNGNGKCGPILPVFNDLFLKLFFLTKISKKMCLTLPESTQKKCYIQDLNKTRHYLVLSTKRLVNGKEKIRYKNIV